jgi:spermidine synthase
MNGILWLCFSISGAAALALEVLWMRSAGLVLGATAATAATVLACYFAGLGLGAVSARCSQQRPVRLYGMLELGAGLGAFWSLGIFRILASDSVQAWLAVSGTVGRVAVVAVALLPATLCLGATLPVIAQALITTGSVGHRGGLLYALNTLGGVLGTVAMGFGLPGMIGVSASYSVAAGASILAGIGALALSLRQPVAHSAAYCQDSSASPPTRRGKGLTALRRRRRARARVGVKARGQVGHLRLVAAGTGALGLGLEVLWTRLFAQVLHNSVYSFTAIALVFLVALALGAVVAALLLQRVAPAAIASVALVTAAVTTVGGLWLFVHWTDGLAYVGMQSGLGEYLGRIVLLAAATAGPAAMASGAVLPALWSAWGDRGSVAHPLGDLTAANMFGGVIGALTAGFIAVPTMGIRGSLAAAAAAYVVLADLLASPQSRLRPLAYAALLTIVVAHPLRAPLIHLRSAGETLRTLIEGAHGVVTVVEASDDLQMRLDNYYVLGSSAAATNERRQGLLPLLLHPDPRRVAFIGLATGITASAGTALGVQETTVVELVPEVAGAARTYFATWNGQLLERSDVRLVLDDGRRYLAASRDGFDVIVSDLFIPWHASAGNLYAREMYETVARRLVPGGVFCQWLPLYQLTREEFDTIVRTFLTVFPQASLWRGDFYPDRPIVGLVGQLTPRPIDFARLSERLFRLPTWSRDALLASPRGLLMLYAGNLTAVAKLFATAPLNTDDHPLIEFLAPRLTRMTTTGDKDWFTGEPLAAFYDTLEARLRGAPDPLVPLADDVAAARRAGTALYHYALAAARHDDMTAARLQAEVRELVPEVILAAESGGPGVSTAAARQELQGLRAEQEQVRQRLENMERRLKEITSSPGGPR